jgi:hypothetical protein
MLWGGAGKCGVDAGAAVGVGAETGWLELVAASMRYSQPTNEMR